MDRDVKLLDGSVVHVRCEDCDLAETLNRVMIEPFKDAISIGWLASGNRAMRAENRIKGYIDYVGSLMIRSPDLHGVLSKKKVAGINANEFTAGAIDDGASVQWMSTREDRRKKKVSKETRFAKLSRISNNPSVAAFFWAPVDTFGDVCVLDKVFHVMDKRYDGRRTTGWDGLYYEFDRVLVMKMTSGEIQFRDQNVDQIDVREKS